MSQSHGMRIEDSFHSGDDHAVIVGQLPEFPDQVHKSRLHGTLSRRKPYVRGSSFFMMVTPNQSGAWILDARLSTKVAGF